MRGTANLKSTVKDPGATVADDDPTYQVVSWEQTPQQLRTQGIGGILAFGRWET